MSRYADPDLCKILYELSGWRNGDEVHTIYNPKDLTSTLFPAYSLDFLIDKLGPAFRSLTHHGSGKFSAKVGYTYKERPDQTAWIIGGHTAPNAVARLAIKLFKQGKLHKEE